MGVCGMVLSQKLSTRVRLFLGRVSFPIGQSLFALCELSRQSEISAWWSSSMIPS